MGVSQADTDASVCDSGGRAGRDSTLRPDRRGRTLPLPCVSAVFVAKTLSFLAVLQDMMSGTVAVYEDTLLKDQREKEKENDVRNAPPAPCLLRRDACPPPHASAVCLLTRLQKSPA